MRDGLFFCDELTRFGAGYQLLMTCTEKGKPVERQGRKATGLRVLPKAAEPPDAP